MSVTFYVKEEIEFKEGKLRVAKYLPGYVYTVTPRNDAFVKDLMKAGKAALGSPQSAKQAMSSRGRGKISTKGK